MANIKQTPTNYRKPAFVAAVILLAACFLISGCSLWPGKVSPTQVIPVGEGQAGSPGGNTGMENTPTSVPVLLSEGKPQPQVTPTAAPVSGAPLTDGEVDQILQRIPTLPALPGEQVEFNLPQGPLPPPRTGQTVQQPFPPREGATPPSAQTAEKLEVLRFAPEGEIPIAPFVSVTFNQPMVPLGTIADLAAQDVPVQIEPALPGTWRWLGTKTLTFNYDSKLVDRLPKATIYKVRVPAGIKSALGSVLDKSVEWSFSTPPVVLTQKYPSDIPQPAEPLIFLAFDQRINAQSVLKTISLDAGGSKKGLRLATDAEVKANQQVSSLLKNIPEGRWLALRPQEPLPLDTSVTITVGPGTPSAEGPLLSKEAQTFGFKTYAPLKVVENGCGWSQDTCYPLSPFYIRFNNPLDGEFFKDGMLNISPELPGVLANIYGDTIQINGQSVGRTTYSVDVSGDLQDIFGQKLGKAKRLTFKVGAAEPTLTGPNETFITLDPAAGKPVFSVYSINYSKLDVQIYAVKPSDWPAYLQYMRDFRRTDIEVKIPGRLAFNKTIAVESKADALIETAIDLKQVMDGDYGQFVVFVKPHFGLLQKKNDWQDVQTWVQVTQIGLDAYRDQENMVAWATALKDGAPLEGVLISSGPGGRQLTKTDAKGLARFAIPDGAVYLSASKGADTAILPGSTSYWGDDAWNKTPVTDELRWYVFDDRKMYRPGEEMHVKGWLRRIGGGPSGDVDLVGSELSSVHYSVTEPQGNEIGSGQAKVNALGGFDLSFTIPQGTNLGGANITFDVSGNLGGMPGAQFTHNFSIQEFRRPEFEVIARSEMPGPYFAGGSATLAVDAKYYAGGPLPNAEVTWKVDSTPGSYSPPNWPDFTFGTWTPWWAYRGSSEGFGGTESAGETKTFSGMTDAAGTHYMRLDFDQNFGPRPVSISAEASVMDVNRQAWVGSTNLLVHPADLYVGLRSERYFVQRGVPLKIEVIVTDLDGKPVVDRPVEVTAARLEWKNRGGAWAEEETDPQKCNIGSLEKPVNCTFQTTIGGSYRITAVVVDSKGRKNQTQLTRWVSGGQRPPARKVEIEEVTLIPDKQTYQPGDTAEVLVQSPFTPAEGLLSVTRSGILYTERFSITDGTATLYIPIEEKHIPNLNLQVDLVGSAPRVDDKGETLPGTAPRPAYATGSLELSVPPLQRTLKLEVKPQDPETEPGKETSVNVTLRDAAGKPVEGAEVAVVVVDEAVLALTQYTLSNPLDIFYSLRSSNLDSYYARSSIILANPQALVEQALKEGEAKGAPMPAAPMMAAAMPTMGADMARAEASAPGGQAQSPIAMRTDFNPLAVFAPAAVTGADGTTRVSFKLPDNLTRYRVMVVAVDGGKYYGTGESNLTARLPLMVRPSAPRFLNFGDTFELPVVLQNQTDAPMEVQVVLRTANIALTGPRGQRVSVPARNRVEVRFPAAAQMAGTARIQVAAVSGEFSDAATVELPVYTPATSEAFAAYGVLDQGSAFQPILAPTNVFPQYGGLEISTSSTALQALTDAVLYLVSYPFECSEQLSSRILGVAALRDVLTAFKAKGLPSAEEMQAAVQRDITRLQGLQNSDGGFPYWRRGQESIPFNTIHTAHALQRAQSKGFEVPTELQTNVLNYLRNIETHYPSWYSQYTRNHLTAYALYVRNLAGDSDPKRALSLLQEAGVDKIGLDALGWLWPVIKDYPPASAQLDSLRRFIANRVVETAGAANFTNSYDDQTYLLLGSDRRTDGILLDALINDNPQSDLIPKLVTGLMAHRTRGRWGSTQENVFVLLALDRYFNTFESQTPDFAARFWLGDTYAGSHEYHGRTTDRQETSIPMNYLIDQAAGGTTDLAISKEGAGRLYYRLGLSYAPTDLQLKPLDMGFVMQRAYEALDDPADVSKDASGVWHIKAGAKVRVRVTMVADNRRYHVALSDPLPAGLEIVNPSLAVSGSIPQDPTSPDFRYGWWWRGTWYEHQNMRDERAEAFTSLLWDGVYQYTYIARATTPGRFIVPPSKAEEMYSPEVFGRSASDVVVVE